IEFFSDGSCYAFNPENPRGVKYLSREKAVQYSEILHIHGNPPILDSPSNSELANFIKHGLVVASNNIQKVQNILPKTLTVWFHVSNACNLACQYCYIPRLAKSVDMEKMGQYFMSSDTAKNAIERLFLFCKQQKFTHLQIKFAGGEPTLASKLISEVCDYATKLSKGSNIKVIFRVLTNGVFIESSILDIFERYHFGVSISLDGDKENHDQIRFTVNRQKTDSSIVHKESVKSGTWDSIDKNINALLSRGIKPYVLCTVTEKNYLSIFNLVKFCVNKEIGFRLSPVRNKLPKIDIELQESILFQLKIIYEWLGKNLPPTMPLERFARFAEWNLRVRKQIVCGTCKSMMSLDQDGNVASCQMRIDKPFGNIKDDSLTSIFNRIKNSDFNSYLVFPNMKTESCNTCYWRYECAGGCPEHTRNALGKINAPSPWCYLYMNLFPTYIRAVALQIKRGIDSV
ncbi:MAG: radical SAM protein, partial [Candidatus Doudnabacteria bacterium]